MAQNRVQYIFGVYDPVSGKLLGVTPSGNTPPAAVLGSAATVATFAALRLQLGASVQTVFATGKVSQADGAGGTFVLNPTDVTSGAWFVGTVSGSVLTVSSVNNGTLVVGQSVNRGDTGASIGTISSFGTGAGGTGTYNLSASASIPSALTFSSDNNSTTLVGIDGSRWNLSTQVPAVLAAMIYGTESGVANAYVFTRNAASLPVTLTTGTRIIVTPLNTNTGAATLNADGTGAVAVVRANGAALTGGEFSSLGPVFLQYNGTSWQIVATAGAQPGFERTATETAQSVIPVNYGFVPGHLYRYGNNTTPGTTDMTTAVGNWAKVGGSLSIPVTDQILVSSTITQFVNNTTITMVEGATILNNTAGISVFQPGASGSISNWVIRGGTIKQTANNATTVIALIDVLHGSYCTIDGVEFIGAQWSAVALRTTSNCVVKNCYIHNSLGVTVDNVDSHDISCYGNSSFNVIDGNQCFGGTTNEHGIMIQDPGASALPLKNTVCANRIGAHKAYGILNYLVDHANTYCTIENNYIEGILGTSQSGATGAGIYNQGAGGTIISNNTVRNCCLNTSASTLTPAGIAMNLDSAFYPVLCVGNFISDIGGASTTVPVYGIEVVSGPANIIGNTVRQSSTATGNIGIYINAASNINCTGNYVNLDTGITNGQGIFAFASGVNISNIVISQNVVVGTNLRGIRVDTSASFTITNITMTDNRVSGGTAASIPLQIASMVLGTVTGNVCSATTVQALDVNNCTQTRITGNAFTTTGTLAINIGGTSTNSYFDKTNWQNTGIKNISTGLICEQFGSAIPTSGFNSAVGDRIEQSVPVAGNPKGWRCTVAGNPGTWVAEDNLHAIDTGWGTSTGGSAVNNFPGATATLLQTSTAMAQLITDLKTAGVLGA